MGHTDHGNFPVHKKAARNEYDSATKDFTNISSGNGCKLFAEAIARDQDPYAPMQTQAELFTYLGWGVDRVWSIIANADHAFHLLDERHRFVENVNNFLDTSS